MVQGTVLAASHASKISVVLIDFVSCSLYVSTRLKRSYNWHCACQTTTLLRDSLSPSRRFLLFWPQPWSYNVAMTFILNNNNLVYLIRNFKMASTRRTYIWVLIILLTCMRGVFVFSPVYIDRSSDMKLVAQRLMWGKFLNSGQTCIAPDYVLCTPEVQASSSCVCFVCRRSAG